MEVRKITNWIICILIGAFIVNIVDMILPESKLKPYINLVCNFIFIFIVISPIVNFFSSDNSLEDKILKSVTEYNERYVESSKKLTNENNNFNLDREYQNNLKSILKLKLDEYGYKLEDINFDGTDIESIKIKETNKECDLSSSNQNNKSKLEDNNKDNIKNEDSENNRQDENNSSEVFKNNTANKNEEELKNNLIKILEVSIDKIKID